MPDVRAGSLGVAEPRAPRDFGGHAVGGCGPSQARAMTRGTDAEVPTVRSSGGLPASACHEYDARRIESGRAGRPQARRARDGHHTTGGVGPAHRVHDEREPAQARARRRGGRARLRAAVRRGRGAGASSPCSTTSTTSATRRSRTIRSAASRSCRRRGYPEWVMRAILSHADYTGVPRETRLEHTLFACDEMAGFVTAAALVRPSKSVLDLEASSVDQADEGQGVRAGRQPRRPAEGRRGARPAARRAHHERDRVHARDRGRDRAEGTL